MSTVHLDNVKVEANLDTGYSSVVVEGDNGNFPIQTGHSSNVNSGSVREVVLYKDDGEVYSPQIAYKGNDPFFEGGRVNLSGPGKNNTVTFEQA